MVNSVKPGIQTTEFWSTLLTQALALVALVHPGFKAAQWQPEASAVAVLAAAVATGIYSLGRSHVKAAAVAPQGPVSVNVAAGAAPSPAVTEPSGAHTDAAAAQSPEVPPAATVPVMPPA